MSSINNGQNVRLFGMTPAIRFLKDGFIVCDDGVKYLISKNSALID